jgi:hypothetical protein
LTEGATRSPRRMHAQVSTSSTRPRPESARLPNSAFPKDPSERLGDRPEKVLQQRPFDRGDEHPGWQAGGQFDARCGLCKLVAVDPDSGQTVGHPLRLSIIAAADTPRTRRPVRSTLRCGSEGNMT